jgi:hypothetical protein
MYSQSNCCTEKYVHEVPDCKGNGSVSIESNFVAIRVSEQVSIAVIIQTCIWEMLALISAKTPTIMSEAFMVFLSPFRQMTPPLLFKSSAIHQSSYHLTLYSFDNEKAPLYNP